MWFDDLNNGCGVVDGGILFIDFSGVIGVINIIL